MDFQRAVQCYLWGIPIVAMEEFKRAEQQNADARGGDIVVYDDYRSKSVILTANATTPYIPSVVSLAEHGPVVIDYPAGATAGLVDDWWDRPITALGLPGPDKGKGAKFLLVGPGQEVPQSGVMESFIPAPCAHGLVTGFSGLGESEGLAGECTNLPLQRARQSACH